MSYSDASLEHKDTNLSLGNLFYPRRQVEVFHSFSIVANCLNPKILLLKGRLVVSVEKLYIFWRKGIKSIFLSFSALNN